MAVILGKEVITDDWLMNSITVGRLHSYLEYLAKDDEREHKCGTTIREAVKRYKKGSKALYGYRIVVTAGLKMSLGDTFDDVKAISLAAGALGCSVRSKMPSSCAPEKGTLLITSGSDALLVGHLEAGWRCYTKDMITLSALRGSVDEKSDEFLVKPAKLAPPTGRRSHRV